MKKNNTFLSQIAHDLLAAEITDPVPDVHCHCGQGFLFYYPMEAEHFLYLMGGKDAR